MTTLEKIKEPEQPIKDFGVQTKAINTWVIVAAFLVAAIAITVVYLSSNNYWMFSERSNGVDQLVILCVFVVMGIPMALYFERERLQQNSHRESTASSLDWYSNVLTPYLSKKYGVRFLETATHSGPHRVEKDGNVFEAEIFGIDFKPVYNSTVEILYTRPIQKWSYNFPQLKGEIELKRIPNRILYEKLSTVEESNHSLKIT